jgi:hypothetical protein
MSNYVYIVTETKPNKKLKVIVAISDSDEVRPNDTTVEAMLKIDNEYVKQLEMDLSMYMTMKGDDNLDRFDLHDIKKDVANIIHEYHTEPHSIQDTNKPPPNHYGKEVPNFLSPTLLENWLAIGMDAAIRSLIYNIYLNPKYPLNNTIRSKNAKMVERFENGKWVSYRKSFAICSLMMNCMTIIDAHLIMRMKTDRLCLVSYLPDSDAFKALYRDVEFMLENPEPEKPPSFVIPA